MYFSDFAVIVYVGKWESKVFIVTVMEHTTKFRGAPPAWIILEYIKIKSILEADENVQE